MKRKVDPEVARQQNAEAAFRVFAKAKGLNKEWSQLDAESKEAQASDEIAASILAELDQEETFIALLKMAMRDALADDHISQLQSMFVGRGGLPGRVRIIVAPDRMTRQYAEPLQGKHDA